MNYFPLVETTYSIHTMFCKPPHSSGVSSKMHLCSMRRNQARYPVSVSSRILQPRAHDSEFGQLPALSSRTLLWERTADQRVWKMQSWCVTVSLFIPSERTVTVTQPSFPMSRLCPPCQPVWLQGAGFKAVCKALKRRKSAHDEAWNITSPHRPHFSNNNSS